LNVLLPIVVVIPVLIVIIIVIIILRDTEARKVAKESIECHLYLRRCIVNETACIKEDRDNTDVDWWC